MRISKLMIKKSLTLSLSLFLFYPISSAFAEESSNNDESSNYEDLTKLSLEELLETEVVTTSKKSESISETPGIVTVITSKEIEQFGANNLVEVLERVPSVFMLGSYLNPQSIISIRGDLSVQYNVHTLILINGRPTRETFFGGLDSALLLGFPLDVIDKIEVVRGPGSVLYGSNAYSGVINIITKKPEENSAKVNVGYGSFNTNKLSGTASYSDSDKEMNFITGLKFFKNDGWDFKAKDEQNNDINKKYYQHNLGSFFSLNYKKFNFNTFISNTEESSLGVIPLVLYSPERQLRNRNTQASRVFMDATYTDNFFEKLNTSLSLTYNNTSLRYAVPTGDSFGLTNDLLLELTGDYVFNENLDLLVGGTSYFLTGNTQPGDDLNRGVPNYFDTWLSAYSQFNYRPFSFLKLVGGGQVNKATNLNVDFVPRLAIIANLTPEFGAKVLYDQAFRAPYEAETSISDPPVLTGNKNLLPEKITSFDTQLFYNTEFYQLSTTYFYNIQKQLITRTAPTDIAQKNFQVTYANGGELSAQGFEFEGKIVPIRNLFITGSFSFQNNLLNNQIKNATLAPNLMGKLGVSYASDLGFSLGVFNTYVGMLGNVANVSPNVKEVNPEATPFNNLTAKVSVNINKVLNLGLNEDVILSLYGVNLLNNKIYYPEFVRKNINTLPGRPGISIYSDLSFGF